MALIYSNILQMERSNMDSSISHATMDSSLSDMRRILDDVKNFPPVSSSNSIEVAGKGVDDDKGVFQPPLPDDVEDFSVLRFGSNCVLKSKQVLLLLALL